MGRFLTGLLSGAALAATTVALGATGDYIVPATDDIPITAAAAGRIAQCFVAEGCTLAPADMVSVGATRDGDGSFRMRCHGRESITPDEFATRCQGGECPRVDGVVE